MLRAELLGLVTTTASKVTAAIALLGLVFTQLAFVTLLPALSNGAIGPGAEVLGEDLPILDLTLPGTQLDTLNPLGASMGGGSIGIALIAVTLLGVLAGTSDDRYGGVVGAVLASPRRSRIVLAKAGALGLASGALGAVLAVVALLTLVGTLVVMGIPFAAGAAAVAAILARGILAVACLALIGLAVGLLLRTQLAGVLSMIAILILEPMLVGIVQLVTGAAPVWTQFLPAALAQNVIHGGSTIPLGAALVGLIGLTGVAIAAATVAFSRRDV